MKGSPTIDIRPDVGVYATYRRLSYKPWYAIAEFVDNATQNYYDHKKELLRVYKTESSPGALVIDVSFDAEQDTLRVSDNANGMNIEELTRALVLDRPPPDTSGRCEFGMGLKTAACWFGDTWTVCTTRLGQKQEYTATVRIKELVQRHTQSIPVVERSVPPESHYTHITIEGVYKPIRTRTSGRIFDQLGSMYREDLRSGEVRIIWNGQPVQYEEPPFLVEELDDGTTTTWRKNVAFEVRGESERRVFPVNGWIGIRNPAKQRDAGMALLRRKRVILGGPGEGYKPPEVFGQGNTYRSQRLIGELHMDSWPVTQAKDTFDWAGELEEAFVDELKRVCADYADKCEGTRVQEKQVTVGEMELATERTRRAFSDERFGKAVTEEIALPDPTKTEEQEKADAGKLQLVSLGPVVYHLNVAGSRWVFRLHWQDKISDAHWMTTSYPDDTVTEIFLNMAHPFFAAYLEERRTLELLQSLVVALALAERMARQTHHDGLVAPSDFRNFMNRVLRHLSEMEVGDGD